jgi:DNA polymerase-4
MIIHIDMDAFFASVEVLDNPDLKGRCVVVGGRSKRGVVAAASYEARKFGIHSAMPMFQARQRCKELVIVPPRRRRYKEISAKVMAIFKEYTPLVEPVSIDEAFMDVSACRRLWGSSEEIGQDLKRRVLTEVHLTCSVGIAPNKFLAKIASDMDKPDGLTVIRPEHVAAFVDTLPIGKVPGVGRATQGVLDSLGIRTLGDVNAHPEETLVRRLGKYGRRLASLARGCDPSPVNPHAPAKSVSSELTLPENTADREVLARYLLQQSEDVARQLRKHAVRAKTITLKVKHDDFKQATRSRTLPRPVRSSQTIYREACRLLDAYRLTGKLRLIGVGGSGLVAENLPSQIGLFEKEDAEQDRWEKVDAALESIRVKYGKEVVKKADAIE